MAFQFENYLSRFNACGLAFAVPNDDLFVKPAGDQILTIRTIDKTPYTAKPVTLK